MVHEKGYVAKPTRERVLKAVSKTGYRTNAIASSLKRRRSNVIGHLLQSTLPNPFFVKVSRGVEEYARSMGYTTLTYNVDGDVEAERRGLETFMSWRVDAVVFSTPLSEANVQFAFDASLPSVQVERPRSASTDQLTVDNYAGGVAAMRHLLELGHRRIAYIGQTPGLLGNPLADYVETERYDAFHNTLVDAGLLDESLIALGRDYSLEDTSAKGDGYRAMQGWLANKAPYALPTAVFASSDILAAGVLQAVYKRGLSVPGDISIVGFDDTFASFLAPMLTTVRLPAHELGVAAAKMAVDRLESKASPSPQVLRLGTELVIRDSTGPPPHLHQS